MPSPEGEGRDLRSGSLPQRETRGCHVGPLEVVRVVLLGGFCVWVGPRVIEKDGWRLNKATALVKLLALAPHHSLHREQVMETLWPELDPKAAANNLYRTLHAARRVLEPGSGGSGNRYLPLEEGRITLCPAGQLWVDVEAFEEAAEAARRSGEPAAYRAALDLYVGDLLPENLYEGWTENRRRQLRRLRIDLLIELAWLYEERGERESAVEALSKVVASESSRWVRPPQ
jgi:DNA-binding SARP family transcriptional activator